MLRIFILTLLTLPLFALEAFNGTTALIPFAKIPKEATVSFQGKHLPLLHHPKKTDSYFILLPIKYRSDAGTYKLHVTYPGGTKDLALHIKKKDYANEQIQVAPSKVAPNPVQQKRTRREYAEAMKIYNTFTSKRYWNKPFIDPMHSVITSPFGTARLFNGHLKSFHSGTDFRAQTGTPVYATNDGVVALAKERFYAGNSVIINHGEGIYSCYYHLSALHVKPGDVIKQGQQLGLSGATGRVSGPHLHYALMLQGVQVDPLQFHERINTLFTTSEDL